VKLTFLSQGWADYLFWQRYDKNTLKRLNRLIEDCLRHPYEGIGKPEQLRSNFSGWWSRRIDQEHRLVYRVNGDSIEIASCRLHY